MIYVAKVRCKVLVTLKRVREQEAFNWSPRFQVPMTEETIGRNSGHALCGDERDTSVPDLENMSFVV